MGSIVGAFVASLLIGLIRTFGSVGFPLFTEGLIYLFMVMVLIARPTGLFGKEIA
jgi:branched-chain amino acid transport system permease protein